MRSGLIELNGNKFGDNNSHVNCTLCNMNECETLNHSNSTKGVSNGGFRKVKAQGGGNYYIFCFSLFKPINLNSKSMYTILYRIQTGIFINSIFVYL